MVIQMIKSPLLLALWLILFTSVSFAQQAGSSNLPVRPAAGPMPGSGPEQVQDPELEKALDRYHQLYEQYPDNPGIPYNLGNLNYLKGDYEKALNFYQESLTDSDPVHRSHALYNLGNTMFKGGKMQESLGLYKQALELNPSDEDIKYNYELNKILLQQQQQQQQQQQDQNKDNNQEEQENQEQQQQEQQDQSQDQQDQENPSEDEQTEQQEEGEREEQSQDPNSEEEQSEEQEPQTDPQPQPGEEEERLGREEAEAILNALQAEQQNMMKRKYQAKGRITVEKDW